MKKKFSTYISLILFIIILTSESHGHYLLFTPQNSNPGDNPYTFLMFVKDALSVYKSDKKKNPENWEALWPYIKKHATGYTVINDGDYKHKGILLSTDAKIEKKKVPYKYIISTSSKWNISTENDIGEDNWILRIDRDTPYRFFKDETSEKTKISEMAQKLKVIKIKGIPITTGITRSRILGNWKFYHHSGFDALIPFLSDTDEACYFRIEVTKALKEIPDLYRFQVKKNIIDEIINHEKKLNPDKDNYRKSLIESLNELKNLLDRGK